MRKALVNIQGKFLSDPDHAAVSVFDRSFLYGDSIYEVIRTYDGKPYGLMPHLKRLKRSADLGYFDLTQSQVEFFGEECIRTITQFFATHGRSQDVYCRLVVSRGSGKISFSKMKAENGPFYAIIVQPLTWPHEETVLKGISVKLVDRITLPSKALSREIKSGNYLSHILGFIEAESSGFDDAIFINSEGFVSEGTTFNLFYRKGNVLCTPVLESEILHGITRELVLSTARQLGLETREVWIRPHHLYEADSVFLSSSTKEIWPIRQIGRKSYFSGTCDAITIKLRQTITDSIRKSLA